MKQVWNSLLLALTSVIAVSSGTSIILAATILPVEQVPAKGAAANTTPPNLVVPATKVVQLPEHPMP